MHKHGIIIGAGIAGLTTAIAMQRNGMPVQVYESAAHILPLGAGIWMAPNAMQVFDRLGLADKINSAGVPLNKIEVADKAFKPVMRTNQDHIRKRFGFTTTAIKRSRLQEILVAETGTENILLAKTCTAIKEEGDNLDIRFSDGSAVQAGFVIAADGIHSLARQLLFPGSTPTHSGYIVWRGISRMQLPPSCKKAIIEAWHDGLRFGFSEVEDGVVDWFAVEKEEAHGIQQHGIQAGLLHRFAAFAAPVSDIIAASLENQLIKNILPDFDPLPYWYKGGICLVGDAAHASTPYMGQGGCQAVEDAWVVAACLKNYPGTEQAFAAFQQIRKSKADSIVKSSRLMGRVGYLRSFAGTLRNTLIRATPLSLIEQQFIRVYSLNY